MGKKINIRPDSILGIVVFTGIFFVLTVFLVSLLPTLVFKVVATLMCTIIYVNCLKLFVEEMLSIGETRMNEFLLYFLMYLITAAIFVSTFLFEPVVLKEFPYIRTIMVTLAGIMLVKYFVYMVLGPIQDIVKKVRHRLYFDHIKYPPLVSILIPAWNEEVGILDTVESLLKSTYRNVEIVVVNDGSTDGSDEKIQAFLEEYKKRPDADIEIRYQYQKNTGKGGALNHALSLARGEIIVSVDADCIVAPGAVAAFVDTFKNPNVMAAVGNVMIANRKSSVGILQHLEYLFSFFFKRADSLLGAIYIIGGAAGAFRREVFEKIGGYNTTNITEDIELSVRIQDAGMKIEYVPEAVVYTEGASDLEGLKKQRLRWKLGRFQTFYQHMHMFFSTKKRHNKVLTWIVMPLALLQEVQLLLEIPFVITLYAYAVLNTEFSSIMLATVVVGMMFVVQLLFYEKSTRTLSFVLLAPIGWILFYVATYVELTALLRSVVTFITGRKVVWQRWERKGIGYASKQHSTNVV